MSFAKLKASVQTDPDKQFLHVSDQYTLPEGWVNHDLPDGRRYRNPLFPDDEFFSATTMLGRIAKMKGEDKWLEDWRARIGDEAADKISKEATDRGTAMHQYLEDYLNGKTVVGKHQGGYQLFRKLKPWCDERVDAVIASEHALYSRLLRVAGRVDLVAALDGGGDPEAGVETLVDFKSSRKIKEWADIGGYCRQVTMYGMMFHETTGVKLELSEIWMSCWNEGNPVAKKFEIVFGNFRETVIDELAEYWASVGQPYENIDEIKRFFL